ncbi:hypothetical protein [Afifella pfennigii]|uniref:hypothetical protein n=1 Tax=Afifella pfennigii TaxID=209897 RepID=UPI0012EC60AE|nr:hypothetical protein [Afifella pfennigii]
MTIKRKIMRDFQIEEISAVDVPAQAHAKMVIMKRADDHEEPDMNLTKIASFDTFDDAVAAIAKAESCPRHKAMSKAAARHPDLYDSFQREGEEQIAKRVDEARKAGAMPQAARNWDILVGAIADRDKCSRTEAMRRARREDPEAFAAFQAL